MGTMRQKIFGDLVAYHQLKRSDHTHVILAVGAPQRLQSLKKQFPDSVQMFFIEYGDLTADLLNEISPDSVIAPAIDDRFDCLDLAGVLHRAGYRGAYRVLAKDLPRPEIIRAELRAQYPDLCCDFLHPAPTQVEGLH